MVCDDLKKSIYLASFKGKLSVRKNNDSNVDVCLNEIIEKKCIDNKELKRRKITQEEEPPYDIPDNWKWVKLGYLADVIRGLTFSVSYKESKPNTILVLRGGNIDSKTEKLIFEDNIYVDSDIPNDNQFLKSGDTLIVASSGTKTSVGKSTFIESVDENISFGGFMMVVRPYKEILNPKYLSYNIKMYRNKIINDTNGYISNITNAILNNLLIPLPPIEEQNRIVEKLEEVDFNLDEAKPIEDKLNKIKNEFPTTMKTAILDYAMKGKLVNNNEEIINNKKESYHYDGLYDIPDNWYWSKIDDVVDIQTGLSFKKTDQCRESDDALRILRGGNINNNFEYLLKDDDVYVTYTDKYIKLLEGDIITPSVTSMEQMGKTAFINKDLNNITAGGFVYIIRSKDFEVLNPKFMMYYINSNFHKQMCKPNIHKSGQAFYNLKKSGLIEQPIPIPPIEEQKRIVEKIEEILPIIESINNMY